MVLLGYFFLTLAFAASPATSEEPTLHTQRQGTTSASSLLAKPIRLILSDLDGTLVGKNGVLHPNNVEAFRLARSLGIQVAMATGRPRTSVLELLGERNLEKMEFSGNPGIYLNGAYVLGPSGEVLRDSPLAASTLKHVLNVVEEEGLLDRAVGVTEGPLIFFKDESSSLHSRVHKVHVEGEPAAVAVVRHRLEAKLGDSVGFAQSHPRAFEVLEPGMNKGEALRLLCAALGIHPDEVLALGNARNDLPMFEVAGTAVAVGDGYDIAKEAADFVTVPSTQGALMEVLQYIKARNLSPNSDATETA
ncbi:Phosphatase YidA, related [Eimeria praecox]|uniref:Phosphatase YidA, related n=1 Tax=Eimeria praecox TaxID=51316 RepID=U6G2W9_9EIME|nr:Phosphatase YidA, related [Eimeria praecox]